MPSRSGCNQSMLEELAQSYTPICPGHWSALTMSMVFMSVHLIFITLIWASLMVYSVSIYSLETFEFPWPYMQIRRQKLLTISHKAYGLRILSMSQFCNLKAYSFVNIWKVLFWKLFVSCYSLFITPGILHWSINSMLFQINNHNENFIIIRSCALTSQE